MFGKEAQVEPCVVARREATFLALAGLFLGSLTMLNILGISRFILLFTGADVNDLLPFELLADDLAFAVAVGVLPYPITFLCTDLISELYGRRRANLVVLTGLLLNLWVVFIMWIGGILPGFEAVDPESGELLRDEAGRLPVFFEIRALTFGAVLASMIAYLVAQFVDVYLFHKIRQLTQGKLLWLRNNASTLLSQLVDTVAVILITYFLTTGLDSVVNEKDAVAPQLFALIATGYVFKVLAALVDSIPFYLLVMWLRQYLQVEPGAQV